EHARRAGFGRRPGRPGLLPRLRGQGRAGRGQLPHVRGHRRGRRAGRRRL
ncbi:MAG: hypothetical protein AVDCRST_MAG07-1130, partial [uncultured Frankineae bacterium]